MKLNYPNPFRCFDTSSNHVCFWVYDSTIEISFFVGMDALKRLCPDMSDAEPGFLQAFDAALNRIHEIADKVHARDGKGSYACILAAEDF